MDMKKDVKIKGDNVKKLVIVFFILIAVINILLVEKLLFNGIEHKIHIGSSMIVIGIQIIAIIISGITLKKYINTSKGKWFIVLLIIMMLITFFIPVKTNLEDIGGSREIVPAVMPKKLRQNLYNITIWTLGW